MIITKNKVISMLHFGKKLFLYNKFQVKTQYLDGKEKPPPQPRKNLHSMKFGLLLGVFLGMNGFTNYKLLNSNENITSTMYYQ